MSRRTEAHLLSTSRPTIRAGCQSPPRRARWRRALGCSRSRCWRSGSTSAGRGVSCSGAGAECGVDGVDGAAGVGHGQVQALVLLVLELHHDRPASSGAATGDVPEAGVAVLGDGAGPRAGHCQARVTQARSVAASGSTVAPRTWAIEMVSRRVKDHSSSSPLATSASAVRGRVARAPGWRAAEGRAAPPLPGRRSPRRLLRQARQVRGGGPARPRGTGRAFCRTPGSGPCRHRRRSRPISQDRSRSPQGRYLDLNAERPPGWPLLQPDRT